VGKDPSRWNQTPPGQKISDLLLLVIALYDLVPGLLSDKLAVLQ
jgi:hypothetical protein